jgi:hypothetical protein
MPDRREKDIRRERVEKAAELAKMPKVVRDREQTTAHTHNWRDSGKPSAPFRDANGTWVKVPQICTAGHTQTILRRV